MNRRASIIKACLCALLITAATETAAWAEQAPVFHFEEEPGPHPVGLEVVEQYDYSRTFQRSTDVLGKPTQGERARPVQTLIWYPARVHAGAKTMSVADYVDLANTETSFGQRKVTQEAKTRRAGLSRALASALRTVRDAPKAQGRFPVVIYAPGASNPSWRNVDLLEYLASFGYVVISSPSMGATTRRMALDSSGLDAQVRDISFLIGYAHSLPNADLSAVAVIGSSWGGMANLIAATRDSRITALVDHDGSMRYYPNIVKGERDVHPDQLTVPLLFFAQREFSLEDADSAGMQISPNVLNQWTHGDFLFVHMLEFGHTHFSSMWQRNDYEWWDLAHDSPLAEPDNDREGSMISYAWVARYTLRFLDAYLKHDASALSFLKRTPAQNGVPRHVMAAQFRPAVGVPASFDGFRAQIGQRGFDHAREIYEELHKQDAAFSLDEGLVDAWADGLIVDNRFSEALALLRFEVELHPDSAGTHETLADAYRAAGNKVGAIDEYKQSLDRDSTNVEARRKLLMLQGQDLGLPPQP